MAQMVEEKYYKSPLGEDEKDKKKRLKEEEKRKKQQEVGFGLFHCYYRASLTVFLILRKGRKREEKE